LQKQTVFQRVPSRDPVSTTPCRAVFPGLKEGQSQSASGPHSSSANHPSRLRFKRPLYAESPALQLSFRPPPPHLHHEASSSFRLPYLLRPLLHHQNQDPGGKTSLILTLRCSFKLMSLSASMSSTGDLAPRQNKHQLINFSNCHPSVSLICESF
ncbi:hypothetical protein AMECASPLE_024342, partial [Ameca splendens]